MVGSASVSACWVYHNGRFLKCQRLSPNLHTLFTTDKFYSLLFTDRSKIIQILLLTALLDCANI